MKDKILDFYDGNLPSGLLFADGLDDAIIGICPSSLRVVYSRTKTIEIFIKDGMDELEAEEFAEYNTFNAYVGEQTPIWVDDLKHI